MRRGRPALRGALGHQPGDLAQGWSGRGFRLRNPGGAWRARLRDATYAKYLRPEFRPRCPSRARERDRRLVPSPAGALSEKSWRPDAGAAEGATEILAAAAAAGATWCPCAGRKRRSFFHWRFLARIHDPGDRLAYGYDVSFAGLHARQDSVGRRFNFHDGLVGFDFQQRLALGNGVAFFFSPGDQFAGFLSHLERGHYDAMAIGSLIGLERFGLAVFLCRLFSCLASTISSTCWLGAASLSREFRSGPSTVT